MFQFDFVRRFLYASLLRTALTVLFQATLGKGLKMNWNNGKERRGFCDRMKKQAEEYRKAGMTEEQISAMYEFDYQVMLSNRRFYDHVVLFDDTEEGMPEDCVEDIPEGEGRYGWVEEIRSPELYGALQTLSEKELELVTLLAIFGYRQREVASSIMLVSDKRVSELVAGIRIKLLPGLSSVQNKNSHNCGGDQ